MEPLFKESGRSARIDARFFSRIVRVELTQSALEFYSALLGFKCKDLLTLPIEQITSIRRVNERGIQSFEVSAEGRPKCCWFDTTIPEEWEQALASVGVIVERATEEEEVEK